MCQQQSGLELNVEWEKWQFEYRQKKQQFFSRDMNFVYVFCVYVDGAKCAARVIFLWFSGQSDWHVMSWAYSMDFKPAITLDGPG